MLFEALDPEAIIPYRATKGSAGYDLFALQDYSVGEVYYEDNPTMIRTGVKVNIPEGYCGQLWCRSGLGKTGTLLLAGLIDSDYEGEVMVLLTQTGNKGLHVHKGDKIAQMVIVPCLMEGDVTVSRVGGFGSTDKPTLSAVVDNLVASANVGGL